MRIKRKARKEDMRGYEKNTDSGDDSAALLATAVILSSMDSGISSYESTSSYDSSSDSSWSGGGGDSGGGGSSGDW